MKMPDAVVGDLDSVWRDAEVWFRDEGSAIVEDPNQYQTDLQKSLRQVKELVKAWYSDTQPANHVNAVVVGGIGGRFDHAFSQLHHLYQENVDDEYRFNGPIYLVNSESICFLLNKGLNCIKTPVAAGLFRQSVGIIPIGRPSVITTRGLEWNLSEQMTEFGGLVSTSNHIRRDWVEVYTTERVLFTMELHPANADSPVIETSAEEISREMDDEESDDELDSISSGQ
ncbi:MAG: hypothetical protein L6R39_006547 [Caloplaca ligustica]|nr:MAG: hypothetical protein L6R39_006547 [Caloplaca ligustica]